MVIAVWNYYRWATLQIVSPLQNHNSCQQSAQYSRQHAPEKKHSMWMWHANIKTGHQTSFLSPSQWVFYFVAFALGNQLKHLNNRKLAAQWGKMEIISQTAVTKLFQVGIVLHKWINLWRVSGSKYLQHGLWGKKALFSCVCV